MTLLQKNMQLWKFDQHVFGGASEHSDDYDYASLPNGFFLDNKIIRIYFSKRNIENVSQPYFIDFDMEQRKIVFEGAESLIPIGKPGTFDDSGVMSSCTLRVRNQIWLYYIGWNLGVTVPFRNSIGLAVSGDDGLSYKKLFEGPILDRTRLEPYFVASCCVLRENNKWKMWYLSCVDWKLVNGKNRHYYHIKYAESSNGIDWQREGIIAIDFKNVHEYAISVPRVIKEGDKYKMWYSYRASQQSENYTIGYAESKNGIDWVRMDDKIKFLASGTGWDSEMVCYPFVFDYQDERYMLYNGNGYGKTGFGIAKLIKEK